MKLKDVVALGVPPTAEVVTVTPALATMWLSCSAGNRKINARRVDQYVEYINEGKWEVTTDGIGFNTEDKLINGHHRLHAVRKAGKAVQMMVMKGLKDEAREFIDIGQRRTPGQSLGMTYQIPNGDFIASAARWFLTLRSGSQERGRIVGAGELAEVYDNNLQSFTFVRSYARLTGPITGTLAYAYSIDPAKISDFAKKVYTKVGIEEDSPEHALVRFREKAKIVTGSDGVVLQNMTASAICHKLKGVPVVKFLRESQAALDYLRKERRVNL